MPFVQYLRKIFSFRSLKSSEKTCRNSGPFNNSVKRFFLYVKEAHPSTHILIYKEHGRFYLPLGGNPYIRWTKAKCSPPKALGMWKTGLKKDSFSQLPALPQQPEHCDALFIMTTVEERPTLLRRMIRTQSKSYLERVFTNHSAHHIALFQVADQSANDEHRT